MLTYLQSAKNDPFNQTVRNTVYDFRSQSWQLALRLFCLIP